MSKENTSEYHKGIRAQIQALMRPGVEYSTKEIVARVDGARQKISGELKNLLESGAIRKVRHGVYVKMKPKPEPKTLIIIFRESGVGNQNSLLQRIRGITTSRLFLHRRVSVSEIHPVFTYKSRLRESIEYSNSPISTS